MKDQDYIHKAVELVGWHTTRLGNQRIAVFIPTPDDVTHVLRIGYLDEQHVLDALAAEAVRQVDAIKPNNPEYERQCIFGIWADSVSLIDFSEFPHKETLIEFDDADRSMNAIKVVIDSGVLKHDS